MGDEEEGERSQLGELERGLSSRYRNENGMETIEKGGYTSDDYTQR